MPPRKPAAPPPVVYVSPDTEKLLADNARLVAQVEDYRKQVADLPALRNALEEAAKEAAILRSRLERDFPRIERERMEDQVRDLFGQVRSALTRAENAEAERDTYRLAFEQVQSQLDEMTSFPCPDTDTEPAPVVHLVPSAVPTEGPVSPCTRAEDAPAAYALARQALASKDPASMRAALAGLPVWPSKKGTALRNELTAALRLVA